MILVVIFLHRWPLVLSLAYENSSGQSGVSAVLPCVFAVYALEAIEASVRIEL